MNRRFRKLLSWGLALTVLLLPMAAGAEGSLLAGRMGQAYGAGRQVTVTLGAQMGSGLSMFLPEETQSALTQLLSGTRITLCWAKGETDQPVVDIAASIEDAQLLTGTLRPIAEGLAVETSLLPGKTVLVPLDGLGDMASSLPLPVAIDDETATALMGSLGTYMTVVIGWVMENPGLYLDDEASQAATAVRSQSVGTTKLRISAAQLKELLVRLTGALEKDTALQGLLAPYISGSGADMAALAQELSQAANGLAPLNGELKVDVFRGTDQGLVGLDLTMDEMFEKTPLTAFAKYDRLSGEGTLAHAFQGKLGGPEGAMMAAMVEYSHQDTADAGAQSDLLIRGMVQQSASQPVSQITLTDKRQTTSGDGQERVEDALELLLESLQPDGTAAEGTTPTGAGVNTTCLTNAQSGDDFDSEIALTINAMGLELATFNIALKSGAYQGADTSGNQVIDLSTADAQAQAALMQELQTGLTMALLSAMQALPPELLQMTQGE